MRKLLPHSRTGLLLLLVACSDRHPTRPDRAAAQDPAAPVGQLSGVATPQDGATLLARVTINGNALGCFGVGCNPSETATITVNGATFTYSSIVGDFCCQTHYGVLGVNGPVF